MMRRAAVVIGLSSLLGFGCTQYRNTPDAIGGPDASTIDAVPNSDGGMCGSKLFFTGETVDWDSTLDSFLGVFDASWTDANATTITAHTAPNGRFLLCLPNMASTTIDVTPPTATDQYMSAIVIANINSQSQTLVDASLRLFKASRAISFFADNGLTFDPTKGQVLVYEAGDPISLSIDATHEQALAANDTAHAGTFVWSAGTMGTYVLFPNVDLSTGMTTMTDSISADTTVLPLAANTISYTTQSFSATF